MPISIGNIDKFLQRDSKPAIECDRSVGSNDLQDATRAHNFTHSICECGAQNLRRLIRDTGQLCCGSASVRCAVRKPGAIYKKDLNEFSGWRKAPSQIVDGNLKADRAGNCAIDRDDDSVVKYVPDCRKKNYPSTPFSEAPIASISPAAFCSSFESSHFPDWGSNARPLNETTNAAAM